MKNGISHRGAEIAEKGKATLPSAASAPLRETSAAYFLPYQEKWLTDESPFKLYEKSRRIGATYATSYRCFQKCMRRQNFTQWVSSRDLLTAKEFITDYIARWCKLAKVVATGLVGEQVLVLDPEKNITAFVASFPLTGSRIVSLSSTPAAFAGKGGDVLLDEVDLHADPGALVDMAMPCIMWGGQLEAVSAYAVDGSPASIFARLCQDAKGANPMHASFHRTTIMDAVDAGLVECISASSASLREKSGTSHAEPAEIAEKRKKFVAEIRARCRTESAWQSQYMCNPQDDGGALLPYGLIAACEADAAALQAHRDPNATAFLGIDVGRKHDLTVMWVVRRLGDVLWTDQIRVLEKTLFREQLEVAAALIRDNRIARCCIDSTGIGAMLAEELQLRFGAYTVEQVQFTAPVKLDLGMPLLQAFQDRTVRIPAAPEIREDLHKIRKTVTSSGNVRLEAESDDAGHADRFWALALALHAGKAVQCGPIYAFNDTRRALAIAGRRERSIAA
jgi:phage FluMu gp28-like protein